MAAEVNKICETCSKEFVIPQWREKWSKRFFCSKECSDNSKRGKSVTKICTACGKKYVIPQWREKWAKRFFCSRKCRSDFMQGENHPNWKGLVQVCIICGKEFASSSSVVAAGRQCCSWECRNELVSQKQSGEQHWNWQGGQVEKTCEVCNQPFLTWPHVIENGHGRFCSTKCKAQWVGENQRGDQHWNWQGGPVERICENCGDTFMAARYAAIKGEARFCSRLCYSEWLSKNQRGEKAPGWQGGIFDDPYPDEWTQTFRKKIRKRDDNTCAICRLPGKDVHHIDYDKQNTTKENCITLCHPCHTTTNGNREYWIAALYNLMQRRMIICQL